MQQMVGTHKTQTPIIRTPLGPQFKQARGWLRDNTSGTQRSNAALKAGLKKFSDDTKLPPNNPPSHRPCARFSRSLLQQPKLLSQDVHACGKRGCPKNNSNSARRYSQLYEPNIETYKPCTKPCKPYTKSYESYTCRILQEPQHTPLPWRLENGNITMLQPRSLQKQQNHHKPSYFNVSAAGCLKHDTIWVYVCAL